MMDLSLAAISTALNGTLVGDPDVQAGCVCTPDEPVADGICLLFNPPPASELGHAPVAAYLVPNGTELPGVNSIQIDNPRAALVTLLELLHPRVTCPPGISPDATVSELASFGTGVFIAAGARIAADAELGHGVEIHANSVIGTGAVVGDETIIHPNVTVAPGCIIGQRVIIHSGAVIGSDGFGYHRDDDGRYHKIRQVGIVVLGDDVEVGAGTTIDRATIGRTVIGRGSKIDNQVQIAHNCIIGEDCCLVAQAGIAGTVSVGDRTQLGGQSGVSDHVKIAADSRVAAQAGVAEDLAQGDWMGTPAIDAGRARRVTALNARLPEIYDEIRSMRRRFAELEARLNESE